MLPAAELLTAQAAWLAPARGRLLRQAQIARRQRVLDLGAGWGAVTGELAERAARDSLTVALDYQFAPLQQGAWPPSVARVNGDAAALPFAPASFDLIFCQLALLWMPLPQALNEIVRLLKPGGVLVALEPDYGGLIEQPPSIAARELWLAALLRAGAHPLVGRQLPSALAERGLRVQVALLSDLQPPALTRFAFLRELPLTPAEQAQLTQLEAAARALPAPWAQVAHLPMLLVLATKPDGC